MLKYTRVVARENLLYLQSFFDPTLTQQILFALKTEDICQRSPADGEIPMMRILGVETCCSKNSNRPITYRRCDYCDKVLLEMSLLYGRFYSPCDNPC